MPDMCHILWWLTICYFQMPFKQNYSREQNTVWILWKYSCRDHLNDSCLFHKIISMTTTLVGPVEKTDWMLLQHLLDGNSVVASLGSLLCTWLDLVPFQTLQLLLVGLSAQFPPWCGRRCSWWWALRLAQVRTHHDLPSPWAVHLWNNLWGPTSTYHAPSRLIPSTFGMHAKRGKWHARAP